MSMYGYKIKPGDSLLGIRYWVQCYMKRIPRFEVFEYIGCDKEQKMYFFKSKSEGSIIGRHFSDLNRFGFKPFLIDWDKVSPYYYGEK